MDVLRRVLGVISMINDSFDPKHPRAHEDTAAYRQGNTERQDIAAAINTLTKQLESDKQQRDEHDRQVRCIDQKRLRIEKIVMWTVIGGTVAGLVTLWFVKRSTDAAVDAANAARNSVALAAANFVRDQQPYVLVSAVNPEGEMAVGRVSFWRVEYRNFGKSPAINMRARGKVFVGKNAEKIAKGYLNGLPRLAGPPVSLLPPNTVQNSFATAQTDRPLSVDEHALIPTRDFALIIIGRFEYEDFAGNVYQSDFCHGTLTTGRIAECPELNTIRQMAPAKP